MGHQSKEWLIDASLNRMDSRNDFQGESTFFSRPRATVKRRIMGDWYTGVYFEKEKNLTTDLATDTLTQQSFNYDLTRYFITSNKDQPFYLNAAYQVRTDDRTIDKKLGRISRSDEYQLGGGWRLAKASDLRWNLTLREFDDLDGDANNDSKSTLLGTAEHKLNLLKKGIVLNTYYESNSGQEPKIEFQYVQVQKGEGSYVWEDFNQDSIMNINEFRLAPQSDLGQFEKISIFNNEFISSSKSILNQSLRINPKKFISNKKSLLRKFQYNTRYRIDQRSSSDGQSSFIQPIITNLKDTSLITYNASVDHSLFYNRGNASHDIQLSYRTLDNVVTQITGRDRRGNQEVYFKGRYNLKSTFDLILESSQGIKEFDAEFFPVQNFEIDYWKLIPQVSYRPNPKFRLVAKYSIQSNQNVLGNKEFSQQDDLGLELTWRRTSTSSLLASFNLVQIQFEGATNTPIAFELLQGLSSGSNYLWRFNYTRRVGKNFDLILNYNGRKSEDAQLVNNLGAQLRAIF